MAPEAGKDRERTHGEPLRLVHHHPGRLRVRAEAFRTEDGAFGRARHALEDLAGIRSVTHSAFTGSVLVVYEPGSIEPDTLLATIVDAAGLSGVVDEATLRTAGPDPAHLVFRAAGRLNDVSRELAGGRADLRTFIPAGLLGAAFLSFLRGKRSLPPWHSLLYWSYTVFLDLNRREADRVGPPPAHAAANAPPATRIP